jgi:hypothetical protein
MAGLVPYRYNDFNDLKTPLWVTNRLVTHISFCLPVHVRAHACSPFRTGLYHTSATSERCQPGPSGTIAIN